MVWRRERWKRSSFSSSYSFSYLNLFVVFNLHWSWEVWFQSPSWERSSWNQCSCGALGSRSTPPSQCRLLSCIFIFQWNFCQHPNSNLGSILWQCVLSSIQGTIPNTYLCNIPTIPFQVKLPISFPHALSSGWTNLMLNPSICKLQNAPVFLKL